jgi:hypothetical protein
VETVVLISPFPASVEMVASPREDSMVVLLSKLPVPSPVIVPELSRLIVVLP